MTDPAPGQKASPPESNPDRVSPAKGRKNPQVNGEDHDEQNPHEKGRGRYAPQRTCHDESIPEGIGFQGYENAQSHAKHKGNEDSRCG